MKKEKNSIALKKAIEGLPILKVDENVWLNIQEEAFPVYEENKASLTSAIDGLPQLNPGNYIWENISAKQKKQTIKSKASLYWIGIAASLFLVLTLKWILSDIPGNDLKIERIPDVTIKPVINSNNKANVFIKQYCNALPSKCSGDRFQSLKEELLNLYLKEKALKVRMDQFPNNIDLIRYYTDLTVEIDQLKKELITIIMEEQCKPI